MPVVGCYADIAYSIRHGFSEVLQRSRVVDFYPVGLRRLGPCFESLTSKLNRTLQGFAPGNRLIKGLDGINQRRSRRAIVDLARTPRAIARAQHRAERWRTKNAASWWHTESLAVLR